MRRWLRPLVLLPLLLVALRPAAPAHAAWEPDGVDLSRPRILFRAADLPGIQARVAQEPWRTVARRMASRAAQADAVASDDHAIASERVKARAARILAFFYAIDRTVSGTEVVPFASPEARRAAGDRVRDLLVNLFPRCRLALEEPLGGWDRDISTSEELLNWASAYDAMLGAGYDFGDARAEIETRLVDLASELYENYVFPATAQNRALDHQNNHRSKSGASLVVAALALAEYEPPPGSDPRGVRDPSRWLAYGLDQVDLVLRWVTLAGDGAYAEGPFYWRFASQNLIPFARAWDRIVDGATFDAGGVQVPSPWRHPLFLRAQRWMLDMTLPDGSLAPVDDGNPGQSYYFGAMPPGLADSAAFQWRWRNARSALETEGNVDLGLDAIALGDASLVPAPPAGPASAFYPEGGNAIFRSDWSPDAILAIAQAEHDTAALFGRDRAGLGVVPQSHEHNDPGSFLMHAFGERLALDPGYLSFPQRSAFNQPQHHNMILVDGRGPLDFLAASFFFWRNDLAARPPTDGQATLSDTLETGFLDAATATVRYGRTLPGPPTAELPLVRRRFLFPDHRYLVLADAVDTRPGEGRSFTWLLHGNGGGTSGGAYDPTPAGGRWSRARARLDAGVAFNAAAPVLSTGTSSHEEPEKQVLTHTVLRAAATGERVRAATILYPTRAGESPPAMETLPRAGIAALRLLDEPGDRRVVLAHRREPGTPLALAGADTGLRDAETDGTLALFDARTDGSLRLAFAESATRLAYDGVVLLEGEAPGRLGIAPAAERAEVLAENGASEVRVRGLAFTPAAADGACALRIGPDGPVVTLGRERRFVLHAQAGNSAPAADPGFSFTTAPGQSIRLDGGASCDADGDALTARWELFSAPAGSAWSLAAADTLRPTLLTDVAGPYRLRLVVTDAHGAASRPAELLIRAGRECANGIDDDLDGFFDWPEDPGCASAAWPVEGPRCSDGLDDDGDGKTDFPADPECVGPHSFREDIVACGLGFELVFIVPLLRALRRRRR